MSFASLSSSQRALLQRGNIASVSDLILTPVQDIARRSRVSPLEIKSIVDAVCKSSPINAPTLAQLSLPNSCAICTSGDTLLDAALGGGFRTGMLWEVVGESAAGKTQLGLRTSLLVQLPPQLGGLAGSACYLLTSGKLPTSRLLQIAKNHTLLASSRQSSLDDIHTMPIPTVEFFVQALTKLLPEFIQLKLKEHESDPTVKPVKLVVIDALGELFHSSDKTSTQTLVQRSHNITEISAHLHSIASKYGIVVLILNEVVDAFERRSNVDDDSSLLGLPYAEQSQWFGRAHNIPGEERKEATLGLVWANQVNARIMMSRTGRRRFMQSEQIPAKKRRRTDDGFNVQNTSSADADQLELVRRISIVFSSVSAPASFDYIVDSAGITILEEEERPVAALPLPLMPTSLIAPLDVGCAEQESNVCQLPSEPFIAPGGEDEWDTFWESDAIQ
ncbi:hypothetical protein GYMLUDRAFT_196861 [Collybiopsis luxurians FD-317 M1]|uniref:RecA family profile 1 domain-containing protein n=1 Tax=Collybiopsis luxurians FD-317 M1 TaxID=944289 RepID=A0A0D0CLL3_9AGAR|nr:hypothetical protein GYMLUDRAFT_196861 [Collybiopsis luxurians FD-317 M1]